MSSIDLSFDNLPEWVPLTELNTPWGRYENLSPLGFISQCHDQLKYFLDNGMSPNENFTKQDMLGYEMVLNTNSHRVAIAFLTMKNEIRDSGRKPENILVIEYLKSKNLWEQL